MFFTYRTFEGNMFVHERLKETSNVRLKDPLCRPGQEWRAIALARLHTRHK